MLDRLARFLVDRSLALLAVLGVVTGAAAVIAPLVKSDFSPRSIFTGNDDLLDAELAFEQMFGRTDDSVLIVLAATGDRDVLDASALQWQKSVSDDLATLDVIARVESLATLEIPFLRITGGFGLDVRNLLPEPIVDEGRAASVRRQLDGAKLVENALIDEARRAAAVVAFADRNLDDLEDARRVVAATRDILALYPPPDGFVVHTSGLPVIRTNIVAALQRDQVSLFPMAGVLFVTTLVFVFRRLSGTLVPLLAAGAGLAWTIAAIVLLGSTFGLISNVLPVLLLVVGMSNAVHVVSRYAEESNGPVEDRRGATTRSIREMILPCVLTCSTTAAGFLSLWWTRSQPLQDFAWQAGLGMACLLVSVLAFSAALLPYLRAPRSTGHTDPASAALVWSMAKLDRTVLRHPIAILAGCVLLVVAAVASASRTEVNARMLETFGPEHPATHTLRFVNERLGGVLPLEITLHADDAARFREVSTYRRVAELEAFVDAQPEVTFARSYVAVFQEVHASQRARRDPLLRATLRDELPTDDVAGRERLARTVRQVERLGDALRLEVFLADEGRTARMMVRLHDAGTRDTLALVDRLEGRIAELFPPESGIDVRIGGEAYVNAVGLDRLVRDVFGSLLGASAVIFCVIAGLFRSLRVGLIAVFPNAFPLLMTLGYMGLRGIDLGAGNVIVFSVGLGIAVDNTIHFIARFRAEHAEFGTVKRALRRTIRGTGRAIVLTSVLLVVGLSVLLFSDFVPTRRFGELITVTMAAALIGDLLVLPVCLKLFWPARCRREPEPRVRTSTDSLVPVSADVS